MDDLLLPWWIDPEDPHAIRTSHGTVVARIDPDGVLGDGAGTLARDLLLRANAKLVPADAALTMLRRTPPSWETPPEGRHPHSFAGWCDLDQLGLVDWRRGTGPDADGYLWRRTGEGDRFIAAFEAMAARGPALSP